MGKFYLEGRGVKKDISLAKKYLSKASEMNNKRAQQTLKDL